MDKTMQTFTRLDNKLTMLHQVGSPEISCRCPYGKDKSECKILTQIQRCW